MAVKKTPRKRAPRTVKGSVNFAESATWAHSLEKSPAVHLDIALALRSAVYAVLPGRQSKAVIEAYLDKAVTAYARTLRRRARARQKARA